MSASLPERPNLEHLRNQAKSLLRAYREGEPQAVERFRDLKLAAAKEPSLADAQRLIARQYGFASWAKLKAHVAAVPPEDPLKLAHAAFASGDAGALRQLLGRHPQVKALVNEPICAFDSPPITCVRSREMLDVLLDAGADINARSRWWAGSFGLLDHADGDLARYAMERGARLTVHAAARLGMLRELEGLIAADPTLVHARGGDGQTPLHFAASVEIAGFLLERGAKIDALDVDHESTAAQYMVRDRQEVARFLVERGCKTDILMAAALGDLERVRRHLDADPAAIHTTVSEDWFPKQNPRSGGMIYIWTLGSNKTPHQVAQMFGHRHVFDFLMSRSPADLQLSQAYALGDEAAVNAILKRHPDAAHTLTEQEQRRVVDAAQDNNTAAVELMLDGGWPVTARGKHAATALHWAAWHGNAEMVRAILRHNPPLEDSANDFRATPLGWAMHGSEHGWHRKTGDYAAVAELLCAAGAVAPERTDGTEPVKGVIGRFQKQRQSE